MSGGQVKPSNQVPDQQLKIKLKKNNNSKIKTEQVTKSLIDLVFYSTSSPPTWKVVGLKSSNQSLVEDFKTSSFKNIFIIAQKKSLPCANL